MEKLCLDNEKPEIKRKSNKFLKSNGIIRIHKLVNLEKEKNDTSN